MKTQHCLAMASAVLLAASLTLCGCGSPPTPQPTPAPTPQPTIEISSPEEVWDDFYQAFLRKDVDVLVNQYETRAEQVVYDPASPTLGFAHNDDDSKRRAHYVALFARMTADPVVHVAELDDGYHGDYKMATLVWSSAPDGLLLVTESVIIRREEIQPGTWVWDIDFHGIYMDTGPDPEGQGIVGWRCDENPWPRPERWQQFACGHPLAEMLPSYADDATLRAYVREAGDNLVAAGPALIGELYEGANMFNATFPSSGTWAQLAFSESLYGVRFEIEFFAGPKDNDFPEFPYRYFSTIIRGGDARKIQHQFLVKWAWEQGLPGAEVVVV